MNLLPLLALTVLSLTACGMQPVKDASPESDLTALRASVHSQLRPRLLPNGQAFCLELAKTEGDQDECAADLEDAFYLAEQDKARSWVLIDTGLRRIELSRKPTCGAFQFGCKADRRALQRKIDAGTANP